MTVTVSLSESTSQQLLIPITDTVDTAEGTDYSVSGLTSGKVTVSSSGDEGTFTVRTNHDTECDDERVDLGFDTPLPSGWTLG